MSIVTAPHAREALGEGIGAQQHHGTGFGDRERFADADRVRADQVDLQFADLVAGDAHVAEFADAGGDGVGDLILGNQSVDYGARSIHALACVGREQHGPALECDFAHRFEGQIVSADVKSVHGIRSQVTGHGSGVGCL